MYVCMLSQVQLFATPWTVVCWPRQVHWKGLPFPAAGDLPNPGIKLTAPTLKTDSLPLNHPGSIKNKVEAKDL